MFNFGPLLLRSCFLCNTLCIPSCAHGSVKTLISWNVCLAVNLCLGWGEKLMKSILSQWTSSLTIKSIDSHNCTAMKRLHYLKFPWRYWPDCHLEQQLQLLHHGNKSLVVHCLSEERGNKAFMIEKIKTSEYAARIVYVQPDINA